MSARSRFATATERHAAASASPDRLNAVERLMGALEMVVSHGLPASEADLERAAQALLDALLRFDWRQRDTGGQRLLGYGDDGKPIMLRVMRNGHVAIGDGHPIPPSLLRSLVVHLLR